MMKDLRESIMIDIKDLLNENLNKFMNEISGSVKLSIDEILTPPISHIMHNNMTPNSQMKPITQNT